MLLFPAVLVIFTLVYLRLCVLSTAEAYLAYRATTSIVLPMPPCVYASLPRCCKVCLFDLPAFEYRPENEPLTAGDKI